LETLKFRLLWNDRQDQCAWMRAVVEDCVGGLHEAIFGGGVFAGSDIFVVATCEAVLRTEKCDKLHSRRAGELVDRAAAEGVLAGVIRDEADPLASQGGEFFGFEDVDAELHSSGTARRALRGALRGTRRFGWRACGTDSVRGSGNKRDGEQRANECAFRTGQNERAGNHHPSRIRRIE